VRACTRRRTNGQLLLRVVVQVLLSKQAKMAGAVAHQQGEQKTAKPQEHE
jgi:hypothetical protein